MISRTVTVADPQGVHALVAHRLCQAAGEFSSSIWIMASGRRCSLVNPIEILAMGMSFGSAVTVLADGLDEADALAAVCGLLTES
ncbi:HPr family phosphocarrier protein [Tessaracoccus caeni]|uniref:HPr family phosphocarrier protein n=1 Tax=Tessaracoccus caeni TaxID=3031239 RepID=UPI0023D9DC94|nr:HPr family phosphocarrier protein [Tessaracoccus caeni]MDF1489470.1 HPr family phosphocarrier protein [Tessaracoccus caeni]